MTPPGSMDRYTRTAALLHWLMALLIIANIAIGLTDGKLASMAVHKSIGLSVLAFAIVRISWREMISIAGSAMSVRPRATWRGPTVTI